MEIMEEIDNDAHLPDASSEASDRAATSVSPEGEKLQFEALSPEQEAELYDPKPKAGYKDPLIGACLEGRYQIESVLGWGGMSVVYKATQAPFDRAVAIKTVKFRVDERPDVWKRFEREVKTLSKLSHPNIVTVYDCVVGEDGQPYVVMDYLKGRSLDEILQAGGRLPLEKLCSFACQTASAVHHAHRNGVIHRDLKPANIMIVEDPHVVGDPIGMPGADDRGLVKVVDFGLAKLGEDNRRLTNSGEIWGSPPYMSPEQIKGGTIDARSDIYSLGAIVYEMATGKDPFFGANVYELMHKHVFEEPPPLKEACPFGDFPAELEQVIFKAMAKDPEHRFQTMADFKEALEFACSNPSGRKAEIPSLKSADNHKVVPKGSPRSTYKNLPGASFGPPTEEPEVNHPPLVNQILLGTLTLMLLFSAVSYVFRSAPTVLRSEHLNSRKTEGEFGAALSRPNGSPAPDDRAGGDKVVTGTKVVTGPKAANLQGGESGEGVIKVAKPLRPTVKRQHIARPPAVEHRASSVKKNSAPAPSPNSAAKPVVKSKFDLLRQMRSPIMKKDAGDSP